MKWYRLLSEYDIFTIKICGMVNETIISTYEIVNLRTILNFVGKKYFSETKGGGYLKCLRGFRGGVRQMSMFVYKGEGGSKMPWILSTWFVHSPFTLKSSNKTNFSAFAIKLFMNVMQSVATCQKMTLWQNVTDFLKQKIALTRILYNSSGEDCYTCTHKKK